MILMYKSANKKLCLRPVFFLVLSTVSQNVIKRARSTKIRVGNNIAKSSPHL